MKLLLICEFPNLLARLFPRYLVKPNRAGVFLTLNWAVAFQIRQISGKSHAIYW